MNNVGVDLWISICGCRCGYEQHVFYKHGEVVQALTAGIGQQDDTTGAPQANIQHHTQLLAQPAHIQHTLPCSTAVHGCAALLKSMAMAPLDTQITKCNGTHQQVKHPTSKHKYLLPNQQ